MFRCGENKIFQWRRMIVPPPSTSIGVKWKRIKISCCSSRCRCSNIFAKWIFAFFNLSLTWILTHCEVLASLRGAESHLLGTDTINKPLDNTKECEVKIVDCFLKENFEKLLVWSYTLDNTESLFKLGEQKFKLICLYIKLNA